MAKYGQWQRDGNDDDNDDDDDDDDDDIQSNFGHNFVIMSLLITECAKTLLAVILQS